jgi:hypothetical protein
MDAEQATFSREVARFMLELKEKRAGTSQQPRRLRLQTVGQMCLLDHARPPPSLRRLLTTQDEEGRLQPFLPLGKVCALVAAGGTGKSQALVQLAVSIATGIPWLGTFQVASQGPVAMLLAEEDLEEVWRRLHRAVGAMGLRGDQEALADMARNIVPVALCGQDVRMVTREGADTGFSHTLRDALDAMDMEWRALILDPVSRFTGVEGEEKNAAATAFVQALERLTTARGKPAVVVAHHVNKASVGSGDTNQAAARGVTAFTDGIRWQANLEKVPGKRHRCLLRMVKSNYTPEAPPLSLQRDLEHGGFLRPAPQEEQDQAETSLAKDIIRVFEAENARAAAEGRLPKLLGVRAIRQQVGKRSADVIAALQVMADLGQVVSTKVGYRLADPKDGQERLPAPPGDARRHPAPTQSIVSQRLPAPPGVAWQGVSGVSPLKGGGDAETPRHAQGEGDDARTHPTSSTQEEP